MDRAEAIDQLKSVLVEFYTKELNRLQKQLAYVSTVFSTETLTDLARQEARNSVERLLQRLTDKLE